jgi:hypothetical protein
MKHQTSLLQTTALLGLVLFTTTAARAQEVVPWEGLSKAIGHGHQILTYDGSYQEDRTFTVVTTSGENVSFRTLSIDAQHLWGDGHDIPGDSVAEVRILHQGGFNDPLKQIVQSFVSMCRPLDKFCDDPAATFVMIPVSTAVGVVSTLPALTVEGFRRLLPARVIKVTH